MIIKLFIPEGTILLENSRALDTMSLEDIIYWGFFAEIKIIANSELTVFIPEICLFQVIEAFSQAVNEILLDGKTRVLTDNRYTGDTLYIEKNNELVVIQYSKTKIKIPRENFLEGAKNFITSSIIQAKEVFPKLNLNPAFNSVVENWLKGL